MFSNSWLFLVISNNISGIVSNHYLFCVSVFYRCNCSIYVAVFSILGADVSALVPFCPAQFNVSHCLHLYDYFELISDDDDDSWLSLGEFSLLKPILVCLSYSTLLTL